MAEVDLCRSKGAFYRTKARAFPKRHDSEVPGSYDEIVLRRLKWAGEFAVDYGSIALIVGLASTFLLGNCGNRLQEAGPEGLMGLGFSVLAVKLWHDVREDRRKTR